MSAIGDFFNKILSVFSTFGISDALDILFVAVIIYGCIRIIRETRAMQLAKGILLLLVMYGIVNLLHMEASSFIFKSIFSNILLLAAILFSPELRNILEQVGKGATGKSLKTIIHPGVAIDVAEIGDCIEATCKACSDMSDQHVGALIVFENETMLGDIIASGTELHAKASRQLIENVFFPKSPLHDGALVIRDGRLYAAFDQKECVLRPGHPPPCGYRSDGAVRRCGGDRQRGNRCHFRCYRRCAEPRCV